MKKIIFIFGTRPEFIKIYPVIKKFQESKSYEVTLLNTGQHREMLDDILSIFDVEVDYNLKIMENCTCLSDILCLSLAGINDIVCKIKPDMVFVHGDTSATLAGSLAGFYNKIPVAHIEAGLRTFNKFSPYPEEVNRQLTGIIADIHFTPTDTTKEYLLKEGKKESSIHIVGNSAIDMLKYTVRSNFTHEILDWIGDYELILVTAHRRENIESLTDIFEAFNEIVKQNKNCKIIYPVHLNPVIQELANKIIDKENIKLVDPLNTIDFHNIMSKAKLILTDSGGIQEEAPSLGIPVLVLRDTTERPEGVEAGTLKLIGKQKENIIIESNLLLSDNLKYNEMSKVKNPYGDGTTSEKIVNIVDEYFK